MTVPTPHSRIIADDKINAIGSLRGSLFLPTCRYERENSPCWMLRLLSSCIIRLEVHLDHSVSSPSLCHRVFARIEIRSVRNQIFSSSEVCAERGSLWWRPCAVFQINIAISGGLSLFFRVVERVSYQGRDLLTVNKTPADRKLCLVPFNIPRQPPSFSSSSGIFLFF